VSVFRLLSRDELIALTGCKRRSGVLAWLRERGWVHETNANGWPVVSAAYAESRLGGGPAAAAGPSGPNLAAVRALQRRAA
jgi:hypothetical protein